MDKPVFDQVKLAVSQNKWDEKKAHELGFVLIQDEEIPVDEGSLYESVVMGAGPSAFGFVKQLISSNQLTPNKDHPPVMVLEAADKIGIKSVYGGAFWPKDGVIFDDDPDYFDDCPHDRTVTKKSDHLYLVTPEGKKFKPPLEPATLFRNKTMGYITPKHILYPYFWNKIESKKEEGYFRIRTGQSCDKLIMNQEGSVVGVQTFTGQKYFANVVIDATGCGALFSRNLSVQPLNNNHGDFFFGIKLICEMPNEKINQVFGLKNDKDGCVLELSGNISKKIPALPGIIGIYPGDGIVNVSVLYSPTFGMKSGLQPHEVMNEILSSPHVKKVTGGSKPIEWSACRLPELHFKYMPKLAYDGYIPLGDTLGLVDFLRKHGVNTGMKSGALAGELISKVIKNDEGYNESSLRRFEVMLKKSWVGKRLMSRSFQFIHKMINLPIAFKIMAKQAEFGKMISDVPEGLPAMSHSDYMALNLEAEGQPDIIIKDSNLCQSCVSEACLSSDPCQAFVIDKNGKPVLDVDPVARPEILNNQINFSKFQLINAEGCLECGNCESACPFGNVIYIAPTQVKGKHGKKNKGIEYRYN
ncbi:MAG: hypothetical protein COA79_18245 [Planctomycetota bacterium]|nr:MAG: hypothetical protein COA79_18245 [Planctomycetota bacterium]